MPPSSEPPSADETAPDPPGGVLPVAGVWELSLLALGRRRRFRVRGPSMAPLLVPGDEVLLDPHAYDRRSPAPGDVIVARHPFQRSVCIVKRVATVEGGRCTLVGEASDESTDSRSFGTLPLDGILGRVTARL